MVRAIRRIAVIAFTVVVCSVVVPAQAPSFKYPQPRKGDTVDDYFGTKVADPYRWMEDLNSAELKQWIDAENAMTFTYLDALPIRDALRTRITELYNYPRLTAPAPRYEGRRWFYRRNTGLQRQSADARRWVKFSRLAWTEDGKGFFYGRYPEPPPGRALEAAVRDKKIYYHALGTPQSADRLIYERKDEPTLFIDAGIDDSGRYLFVVTNKGTSNKNELFVKDLGDPLSPNVSAPVRPLYPGHTAAYEPLGVVNGSLYLVTDRDAPNRKVVAVPIDRPDPKNWKTIVAQTKDAIESARLMAGK